MTSQAKPKQKIRRAPFRIAEQYSHRNIFQRKSKKNGCKNEFFGAGNIAAGDPPGSGTTLLPSGNMERPRRRRVPHYQLLLLWRRASLLTFPQQGLALSFCINIIWVSQSSLFYYWVLFCLEFSFFQTTFTKTILLEANKIAISEKVLPPNIQLSCNPRPLDKLEKPCQLIHMFGDFQSLILMHQKYMAVNELKIIPPPNADQLAMSCFSLTSNLEFEFGYAAVLRESFVTQ